MIKRNANKAAPKQVKDKQTQGKANQSGAQPASSANALQSYVNHHRKTANFVLKEQIQNPFASLFTAIVIGIAFVLPVLLAIVLNNIQALNFGWDGSAKITLFLNDSLSESEAISLTQELERKNNISSSLFISKQHALNELAQLVELERAASYLDDNPLPHSIVISPHASLVDIAHIEALTERLEALPEVDSAQLDVMWVRRLSAITSFFEQAVWLVGIMLSMAVLLVLGNTIRLAIENKKEEIIVLKLVGGTDAFVCRPFLYMGMFFGLAGSLIAIALATMILGLLNSSVEEIARSYQSQFSLSGLNFASTILLLATGTGLGWLGSWLAVRKHLKHIEPT